METKIVTLLKSGWNYSKEGTEFFKHTLQVVKRFFVPKFTEVLASTCTSLVTVIFLTTSRAFIVACIRHPIVQPLIYQILHWMLSWNMHHKYIVVISLFFPLTCAIISDPAFFLLLLSQSPYLPSECRQDLFHPFINIFLCADVCKTTVQPRVSLAAL